MVSLDTLSAGSTATIVALGGERAFRCRLMEMGLLPGTALRLIRRRDIGGVLELEVRGCRLSVRRREALEMMVEPA